MDYEKKYLKYKSKYNLKKSSLLGSGGGEAIMTGGNMDRIADLVRNDVPMLRIDSEYGSIQENKLYVNHVPEKTPPTEDTITWKEMISFGPEKKVYISDQWRPYIKFNNKINPAFKSAFITYSFKENITPNTPNTRGQTLLYLAAQNCNKIMFDALVAMGASLTDVNHTSLSNILHGIAWGKVNDQGRPIKTYDDKVAFMQDILKRYPDALTLLFQTNAGGETCYDNLLMRHPDKISKGLEHVAFPVGWIRQISENKDFYVNSHTNQSIWQRPY